MSTTAQRLMEIYRAARDRFGHQNWWPGDTPLEICVGAVLTQNTSWTNVEKAIANLKSADCLTVEALCRMPQTELAELIRPAGYFNIKARRLKNFIDRVHECGQRACGERSRTATGNRQRAPEKKQQPRGNGQDEADALAAFLDRPATALREDLLAINGIGRETADSIILYAAGQPAFVVDAYTCRILLRHRLIDADSDYEAIKDLLESNLPLDVELYNDFHAQFVAVGKNYCRPAARCGGCPLEPLPHDRFAGTQAD